ncbi:MAG: hypothetical protein ACREUU_01545, partial [Gammaproteobacteria bacterium]
GEPVPFGAPADQVRMQPTVGRPMVFAFSYVLSHNGYIIYSDVHSGLYILKYTGPRKEEIPPSGICLSGNPGLFYLAMSRARRTASGIAQRTPGTERKAK